MTTSVFRAPSLVQARLAAVAALGDDAVILTTRHVRRGGLFGLFGATDVEIAAATLPKPAAPPTHRGPFASGAYTNDSGARAAAQEPAARAAVVNALRADLRSEIRAVKLALARPTPEASDDAVDLAAEVSAIREALEQLTPPPARGSKVASLLRARGIEGKAAAALTKSLKNVAATELDQAAREALRALIPIAPWSLPKPGQRVVVSAIGPSGVGKTTTLAKLATLAKAAGFKVDLVTTDTFRVGGVEQVRRYATLLSTPFESVSSPDDLETFLKNTDADLVIVDTSGRVPRANAAERVLGAKAFSESQACRGFERQVLLCVPAASREVDAIRIVRGFSVMSPTALAITKLDETGQPSGILHAALASSLPIALTCAGQRVPEDLDPAEASYLVEQLVPAAKPRREKAA